MLQKLALRNLGRNPRRSLVVTLIVALGTGALFLFLGFNEGIMNQYKDNTIRSRYGHGQIFTKDYRTEVWEEPWEHWIEDYSELEKNLLATEGVDQVFPRINFYGLLTNGNKNISGRGQGVIGEREHTFFNTLNVVKGSNLIDQKDGILLGKGLADTLDLDIGDRVTILANTVYGSLNGVDTEVAGIFHTGSKEFDDTVFRIQLSEAQILLDTEKVETISVGLLSEDKWPQVENLLDRKFPETYDAVPFHILDKIYYQHSVDWLRSQFGVIQLIILAIVILGILSTVSTSVFERKNEIGMLRANGESKTGVFGLLCLEGFYLGLLGAVIGILFSLFINLVLIPNGILMPPAPGLTRQFYVKIELGLGMGIYAFSLGCLTAFLGAIFASLKVVSIPITEALRST